MPIAPITASAPRGIDESSLGAPVDSRFRPLQGEIGESLFPDAKVHRVKERYVAEDAILMRDTLSLDANLAAWTLADASIGDAEQTRFATYRAYEVVSVSTIDDRTEMDNVPPEAAFYISKIYWGAFV